MSEDTVTVALTPTHSWSWHAEVPVAGSPSSQIAPSGANASAGQAAFVPSQTSATSQASADGRHTSPAARRRHWLVQQLSGRPFALPRSQVSPASVLTTPSPQLSAEAEATPPSVVTMVALVALGSTSHASTETMSAGPYAGQIGRAHV